MKYLYIMLLTCGLYARPSHHLPPHTDEPINELSKFSPWYTGTLLATSGYNEPPGEVDIQGYLFFSDTYGKYDSNESFGASEIEFKPVFFFETGITSFCDLNIVIQSPYTKKGSQKAFGYGDTSIALGWQVAKENPHSAKPAVRILTGELFPTGKYRNLDEQKKGIDATGAGSFQTTMLISITKILYWFYNHPLQYRFNFAYVIPANVHVTNFNAYGGGFNTDGTVKPGQSLLAIFAVEYSLNQNWVLATDISYTYTFKTTFSGIAGTTVTGAQASVNAPASQSLILTPTIEYNFSLNLGALLSSWFTVWGKHTDKFGGAAFSVTYVF